MNIVEYWADMASVSKRALKIVGQSSLISMTQNKAKMWCKCFQASKHFQGRSQKQGTPSDLEECSHWHSMKRGSHEHMQVCVAGGGSPTWSTLKKQDKSTEMVASIQFTTNSLKNLLEAWCGKDSGREVMTSLLFGHPWFYRSDKNYEVPLPMQRHSGMWGRGSKPQDFQSHSPGFKSQTEHSLATWSWTSHLTSSCPWCLWNGIIMDVPSRIKENTHKGLNTMPDMR